MSKKKDKISKYIFINKVQAFQDEFSWQEENCFYRPFAIGMKSICEEYYNDFLMYISFSFSYGI